MGEIVGKYVGKNWAIRAGRVGDYFDYVKGVEADTPEKAVAVWRKYTKLYFIDAEARRTTEEEDKQLELPRPVQ